MSLANDLLLWYDENRRSLPWRGTKNPYRIWLSEVMLQQTRTETVMRYYEKFLSSYPAVQDLAAAPEDQVLKLWEGLGYYSRARNLHAAAKKVSYEYGGIFPRDAASLRALPGVGPYAANAIASIAYDEIAPALDGNQARVLSRILAWDAPVKTPFDLLSPALDLISRDRPGDYNQALMDLGAGVCTPKKPRCADCPIQNHCRAYLESDPESYPKKLPPIAKREEDWTVVVALCEGKLVLRKRPAKGLLGGMYEFIMIEGHPEKIDLPGVRILKELPPGKHVFTHLIWRMRGVLAEIPSCPEGFILADSLDEIAVPSALRIYREAAQDALSSY